MDLTSQRQALTTSGQTPHSLSALAMIHGVLYHQVLCVLFQLEQISSSLTSVSLHELCPPLRVRLLLQLLLLADQGPSSQAFVLRPLSDYHIVRACSILLQQICRSLHCRQYLLLWLSIVDQRPSRAPRPSCRQSCCHVRTGAGSLLLLLPGWYLFRYPEAISCHPSCQLDQDEPLHH